MNGTAGYRFFGICHLASLSFSLVVVVVVVVVMVAVSRSEPLDAAEAGWKAPWFVHMDTRDLARQVPWYPSYI
jgi:hypothetical protein